MVKRWLRIENNIIQNDLEILTIIFSNLMSALDINNGWKKTCVRYLTMRNKA